MAPRVVVVDDDPDTVSFLSDFFDMLGMVVVPCNDGRDAPTCIADHAPDVVILDIALDGVTGLEVFDQVRADPATRTVPVIFFTGSGDVLRQRLPDYAAHGAYLVVKPYVEQLSALVQRLAQQST